MGLRAQIPLRNPEEAEAALMGLVAVNVAQLRRGARPITAALRGGRRRRRLRYIRLDRAEEWRSILLIWRHGGGDCEDLAAAVAAELIVQGIAARVVIRQVRPGLWHALVLLPNGVLLDPSKTGGMGEP